MILGPPHALATSSSWRSNGKTMPLARATVRATNPTMPRMARTGQMVDAVPARTSEPVRPVGRDRSSGHSAGTWATRGSRRASTSSMRSPFAAVAVDSAGWGAASGSCGRHHAADRLPQLVALCLQAQPIQDVPLLGRDVQREQRPIDGSERRGLVAWRLGARRVGDHRLEPILDLLRLGAQREVRIRTRECRQDRRADLGPHLRRRGDRDIGRVDPHPNVGAVAARRADRVGGGGCSARPGG